MRKKSLIAAILVALCAFLIPIERKYDKIFRHYSLILIPKGLQISKQYDRKIYFYPSDLLALVLFCLGFSKRIFKNPLWLIWLFALFSIAASPFSHYPIAYMRLLQLFTPIALFSFLSTFFSEEEKPKLTRLILVAIVSAGLLQTAIGTLQYFLQDSLGLRLLGERGEKSFFFIEDGSRWLIDQLQGRSAEIAVMRAQGTFSNANVFGGLLFLSILASYALITESKSRFLLFTLPFQFFALLLSFSRSAFFAWGIASLIWGSFMAYRYGFQCKKLKAIASVMALSLLLSACLLHRQYFYRGGIISSTHLSKDSNEIRKVLHKVGLAVVFEHPLFGLGWGQFSERSAPYFTKESSAYIRSTAPHTIFLFLACETGLISTLILLFFLAWIYGRFVRSDLTVETITFASLLTGYLFIGCCDFYLILFQQGKLMFFLTAALLVANTKKNVLKSYAA